MYERNTYNLHRYEIVTPSVRNDGSPSDYLENLRERLEGAGFSGWTEIASMGFWLGKLEPGTTIVIYAPPTMENSDRAQVSTATILARIGRASMPDQDAVQVVHTPIETTLIEA